MNILALIILFTVAFLLQYFFTFLQMRSFTKAYRKCRKEGYRAAIGRFSGLFMLSLITRDLFFSQIHVVVFHFDLPFCFKKFPNPWNMFLDTTGDRSFFPQRGDTPGDLLRLLFQSRFRLRRFYTPQLQAQSVSLFLQGGDTDG